MALLKHQLTPAAGSIRTWPSHTLIRSASPPAPSGTASSFPMTRARPPSDCLDLDLKTVSGSGAVDGDGRHEPTLCPRGSDS